MLVLVAGIVHTVVLVSKHIEEIVEQHEYTNHISDIEITCKSKREEDNEDLVFSVLYKLLKSVCDQGQPHNRIHPHGVVLMNDAVRRQSVHYREGNDCKLIFVYRMLVQIERHRSAADRGLQHKHHKQKFLNLVSREKQNEI